MLAGAEDEDEDEEEAVVVVAVAGGFAADVFVAETAVGVVDEVLVLSAPCDETGVSWRSEGDEQVGDTSPGREVADRAGGAGWAGGGGTADPIEDIAQSGRNMGSSVHTDTHARGRRGFTYYTDKPCTECSLARATKPRYPSHSPGFRRPEQLHDGTGAAERLIKCSLAKSGLAPAERLPGGEDRQIGRAHV